MITVSEAWKDIQQRFLLTESYIEIDCTISEEGAQESASIVGTNETAFSDVNSVLRDTSTIAKYATTELNLWVLDGKKTILPNSAPYGGTGYVSNIASTGSVTLSFSEIRTVASSGLTITWSATLNEYPTVFSVIAKNGNTIVAQTTITDNTKPFSTVFLELVNYDSITINVLNWCLPNRRARIEKVVIGHVLTLTKDDILSFKHEQSGDLLSGELPKYSIEFTLDNSDGRWDPNNPTGMERYLSERQKLVVRYGLDVNGTIEWIKAGTFYLSEWDTPSNGLEARFVARDMLEFLLNKEVAKTSTISTTIYGNLESIITWAMSSDIPPGASVEIDESLSKSAGREPDLSGSFAEIVQKCANAGRCVMRYDREGVLHIEPLNKTLTQYKITQALSYSHPEVKLSKPLRDVEVDYGGETSLLLAVSGTGETQRVTNDYIYTEEAAGEVAAWVRDTLTPRKTVSGEFRADPRLDLFDIVAVESKYGLLTPVAITNITYTFNGSFRGSYTGRIL